MVCPDILDPLRILDYREERSSLFEQIHDHQYKDIKCSSLRDHVVSGESGGTPLTLRVF